MPSDSLADRNVKIILVEDNDDDAALLERHLRRSGMTVDIFRVQTAIQMERALQHINAPDVVLADYNLPEFSGPAALQALKAANLDLPFIMLSGAVSEETAVASMRAGAHDYVSKDNLVRLVPAIQRELKEAASRGNRLAAERALHASEARFDLLVEAMPMGLLISDASSHIIYANGAAERLLRYPESALLSESTTLQSICPALSDAFTPLSNNSRSSEPFESVCITFDGSEIEVLIGVAILNPQAASQDRQLAAFMADITLQKKSEELVRRTEKLAVAGRLASSMAHEINNPLEAVTNLLYLSRLRAEDPEQQVWLDEAEMELRRISIIANQTLRFHKQASKPQAITCGSLFSTTLSVYEARLKNAGITVEKRKRANEPVECFEGDIRQVLSNIVTNAIDSMPNGGRLLARSREGTDWRTGRKGLVLTLADTGTGMDQHVQSKMYEAFFSTKGIGGSGLGLWISADIMHRHQGRISIRSSQREGRKGTVVALFLPFKTTPEVGVLLVDDLSLLA
jgi:PAS domain S-box-containing protein